MPQQQQKQPAAKREPQDKGRAQAKCPYYDAKGNLCMCMYPCMYLGVNLQCSTRGTTLPRRPGQAAPPPPIEESPSAQEVAATRTDPVVEKAPAARPAPRVSPAARVSATARVPAAPRPSKAPRSQPGPLPEKIETRGTMEECAAGSEGFYCRGICLGGEHDVCRFQTAVRLPVKSSHPDLQNRTFTRCVKYNITRCPRGDRSLYHPERHVCLATGKAPCPHQVASLKVPLEDGKEYDYCARYE
jgi:hypothetical protein